jgi:hypothetical protein
MTITAFVPMKPQQTGLCFLVVPPDFHRGDFFAYLKLRNKKMNIEQGTRIKE